MMSVEDRAPKKARTEEELITFSDDDTQHVRFPHSDPLVMDVQISNMMVKRVLVDQVERSTSYTSLHWRK